MFSIVFLNSVYLSKTKILDYALRKRYFFKTITKKLHIHFFVTSLFENSRFFGCLEWKGLLHKFVEQIWFFSISWAVGGGKPSQCGLKENLIRFMQEFRAHNLFLILPQSLLCSSGLVAWFPCASIFHLCAFA